MKTSSPSEDQAEQGADQNEDLVEHGRVGPLDGSVDVILPPKQPQTLAFRGKEKQTNPSTQTKVINMQMFSLEGFSAAIPLV